MTQSLKARAALVLVDLQNDFIERLSTGERRSVVAAAQRWLQWFRSEGLPVVHLHTEVVPDLSNALPRWREEKIRCCIEDTPGVESPNELAPESTELLVIKQGYSPAGRLATGLNSVNAEAVVVVGLFSHACVRDAAIELYESGYQVNLGWDAVASYQAHLHEAAHRFLTSRIGEVVEFSVWTSKAAQPDISGDKTLAGLRIGDSSHSVPSCTFTHLDPYTQRPIYRINFAEADTLASAMLQLQSRAVSWRSLAAKQRAEKITAFAGLLEENRDYLIELARCHLAKSEQDINEELVRTARHLRYNVQLASQLYQPINEALAVKYQPMGCVAVITPWNNPVALAVAKISSALVCGNSVVWKPAPEAAGIADFLYDLMLRAFGENLPVLLLQGDARVGDSLLRSGGVDAVTLTGSTLTGRRVKALCDASAIRLQAELGGNNGLIVMPDADFDRVTTELMQSCFSYSGQRCTAIRRIIVVGSEMSAFAAKFVAKTVAHTESSSDSQFALINSDSASRVAESVKHAIKSGVELLTGGEIVQNRQGQMVGYRPTVLHCDLAADELTRLPIYANESFAPVVVLTPAASLEEAIYKLNATDYGLIAAFEGGSVEEKQQFLDRAEAGMLRFSAAMRFSEEAPFGGVKSSAVGVPEHGRWGLEFYTSPQAIYLN